MRFMNKNEIASLVSYYLQICNLLHSKKFLGTMIDVIKEGGDIGRDLRIIEMLDDSILTKSFKEIVSTIQGVLPIFDEYEIEYPFPPPIEIRKYFGDEIIWD